jgi:hypothetical protein
MSLGVKQNTIGRQFDKPWEGSTVYLEVEGSNKIPKAGSSIYRGMGVKQNTIGRCLDIPREWGSYKIS